MVRVDSRCLAIPLLITPLLGLTLVLLAWLMLPQPGIAQVSIQSTNTVACNSLVSATSSITLLGTITGPPLTSPTPVNNVQIFVFDTDLGDGQSCLSNSSGQYTITMDAAHTYDVVFNPPPGSHLASQIKTGINDPGVTRLDILLNSGFSISGVTRRLSDNTPVGNVAMYAYHQQTGVGFGLPPSQADGTYQISLEPGMWDLTFTPPPFLALGPTTILSVSLTADITQDAFLPPGVTVYGPIKSPGGQGVPGTNIYAYITTIQKGFGFAPSKAEGWYTGTLPLGEFDIQFLPPTGLGLGSTIITNQNPPTSAYYLPVTLPAGFTLSGTIACTVSIEGAFVFADPDPDIPGDDLGGWGNYSDSQGHFGLALVPSVYRIEFVPPPITGLSKQVITRTIQADTSLIFDFCPEYLPLVQKNAQ